MLSQLMIVVALCAAVVIGAAAMVRPAVRFSAELTVRERLSASLGEAGQLIKSVGRTADWCDRSGAALHCALRPMTRHNRTNLTLDVVFELTPDGLDFQKFDLATAAWIRVLLIPGITQFDFCDGTDMRASPSTCAIQPVQLSAAFASFTSSPDSFFRFKAVASGSTPAKQLIRAEYQSSFAVRNQSSPTIKYE